MRRRISLGRSVSIAEASLDAEIDESGIAMLRGVFSFQYEEDGERKMGNTGKGRQEVNLRLPQATDITTATLHVMKVSEWYKTYEWFHSIIKR
jgi:hypothetical protein